MKLWENSTLLRQLFWSFLKIGPVTFGGGYAMIPLVEREVVHHRRWMEEEELNEIFTTSGSAPGAIAVNAATYIGYRLAGAAGAITATLGMLLPTVVIALLLGIFILHVQEHPIVQAAFTSIRATVIALIAYAAYKFGKLAIVDKMTVAFIIVAVVLLFVPQVHPIFIILGGGIAGIVIVPIRGRLGYETRLRPQRQEQQQEMEPDWFMGDGI